MHVCLVTSRLPPNRCGVGDYVARLAAELTALGCQVTLMTSSDQRALDDSKITVLGVVPSWHFPGIRILTREIARLRPDVTVIQWVPFLYGRRGINLALPLAVLWMRFRGTNIRLMVHEPWVPLDRLAFYLSGPVQRLSLWLLVLASRRVGVSIQRWTELLQRIFPWKRQSISWEPVGSNIPLVPLEKEGRCALRRKWGLPDSSSLIAVFSPLASGVDGRLLEIAWRKVREQTADVHLVVIGASAGECRNLLPSLCEDTRCLFLGYLTPGDVSACLQAVDILFAPFTDGISTRRTSAISAMAHSLPIVTTRGMLSDVDLFETSPILYLEPNPSVLSDALLRVCRDRDERSRIAKATFQFFQANFSWEKIAARFMGTLPGADVFDSTENRRVGKC